MFSGKPALIHTSLSGSVIFHKVEMSKSSCLKNVFHKSVFGIFFFSFFLPLL